MDERFAGLLQAVQDSDPEGREFNEHDTASAPSVVLINEAFEKEYFQKENPIGQQINVGKGMGPPFEEPPRQIVAWWATRTMAVWGASPVR